MQETLGEVRIFRSWCDPKKRGTLRDLLFSSLSVYSYFLRSSLRGSSVKKTNKHSPMGMGTDLREQAQREHYEPAFTCWRETLTIARPHERTPYERCITRTAVADPFARVREARSFPSGFDPRSTDGRGKKPGHLYSYRSTRTVSSSVEWTTLAPSGWSYFLKEHELLYYSIYIVSTINNRLYRSIVVFLVCSLSSVIQECLPRFGKIVASGQELVESSE
jgi:hypothetical protein